MNTEYLREKTKLTEVKCTECGNFLNKCQVRKGCTTCSHLCANKRSGKEKRGVTIRKFYDVRICQNLNLLNLLGLK